jgi:hypothetical protein
MPLAALLTTAHQPVGGEVVVTVFLELIERSGAPASTLTDNALAELPKRDGCPETPETHVRLIAGGVELRGLEPLAFALPARRSTQLSYSPDEVEVIR